MGSMGPGVHRRKPRGRHRAARHGNVYALSVAWLGATALIAVIANGQASTPVLLVPPAIGAEPTVGPIPAPASGQAVRSAQPHRTRAASHRTAGPVEPSLLRSTRSRTPAPAELSPTPPSSAGAEQTERPTIEPTCEPS